MIPILFMVISLSGCDRVAKSIEGDDAGTTINPLDPGSMVDVYEDSKVKIQDAVDKENERLNETLKIGE
ncbi:hypothetical protein ACFL08_00320 [Patescibacteria group bacterium]